MKPIVLMGKEITALDIDRVQTRYKADLCSLATDLKVLTNA